MVNVKEWKLAGAIGIQWQDSLKSGNLKPLGRDYL